MTDMIKSEYLRWLIVLFVCCAGLHAQPILEDGIPFDPKGVKIKWAITNEQSASKLRVFRSVPRIFSNEAVSNLLSIAGLSENDRIKENGIHDSSVVRFASKDRKGHSLILSPNSGCVELQTPTPNKDGQEGDLIPSRSQVIQRGSNLFVTLFNIGTNEWAFRDGRPMLSCSEGTHGSNEPQTKRRVKCVINRGVFFYPAVDGYLIMDQGTGAEVEFCDYGKIFHLKLNWPALKAIAEVPRASLDYCKQTVAQGGACWDPYGLFPAKRLIIQRIDYCYLSQGKRGEQNFFSPIIRLGGTVYDGHTNSPVSLFCRMPLH